MGISDDQLERLITALEAQVEKQAKADKDPLSADSRLSSQASIAEREEEIKRLESAYSNLYRSIDRSNAVKKQKLEIQKLEAAGDEAEIARIQKKIDALEGQKSASSDIARKLQESLGLGQGQVSKQITDVGQQLSNVNAELGGGIAGAKGMAKAIGGGLGATLARLPMKPIELLVEQTLGLAVAQDKVISKFRKATGATKEYNYEITQLERRNFAAGVSIQESGEAFQTLFTSFSAFTELNKSERAAIGDTVAVLGELGLQASTSGMILDQMFRGLNMSAQDANNVLLDLAGSAQALGVPMQKMAADFSASFKDLAKYGDGAIDVFKELSVISKSTGMEVSRLIAITDQFETFDGAATSVGKLNAILGGPYLNSIDMLNASEEERVRILRDQVAVSGLQFEQLGRYEKKTIASALGVSVDEAQRLLGLSEEQYQLDALSQQEAAEQAAAAQDIASELKSAFMALAVDLRPLIDDVIKPMIGAFRVAAQFIGKATNALGQFASVGLVAGGIAALIAAPFTGGASLGAWLALGGIAGVTGIGTAALASSAGGAAGVTNTGPITPGFAAGGTITTEQAAVHPGEMIVTGGQGSDVLNKEQIADMISKAVVAATTAVQAPPQQIAVYVGQEKIDELVVKGINSPAGQAAFAPFGNG
jgi:hypothetical protein